LNTPTEAAATTANIDAAGRSKISKVFGGSAAKIAAAVVRTAGRTTNIRFAHRELLAFVRFETGKTGGRV
jgi:hypothetical protein